MVLKMLCYGFAGYFQVSGCFYTTSAYTKKPALEAHPIFWCFGDPVPWFPAALLPSIGFAGVRHGEPQEEGEEDGGVGDLSDRERGSPLSVVQEG